MGWNGSEEFDKAGDFGEGFRTDDGGALAGFGGVNFCFDEGFLGAMVATGSLTFAETGEGIDKTQIEFGFVGERLGEGCRVESQEKLIKLGGGDGATGILDSGPRFLADQIKGGFAGGPEGLVALEIEEP